MKRDDEIALKLTVFTLNQQNVPANSQLFICKCTIQIDFVSMFRIGFERLITHLYLHCFNSISMRIYVLWWCFREMR